MRGLLFVSLLVVSLVSGVQAQERRDPAIETVIQNQIDAFKADDFATAFTYASPMIQRMFGSSERFGMMVRQGYPMVWRPASVQYLGLRDIDGRLWQIVMMQDTAGVLHTLGYQMIETPDGWQINGVQILQGLQEGV